MSLELTVVAHQDVHHNKQAGKSQWTKGRDVIDPELKNFVSSKEQELRMAIDEEKISREPGGALRNVFYIVDGIQAFPEGCCQGDYNGVCVEVVIVKYGENLKADIHGYPVVMHKAGISLSKSNLCS